MACAVWRSQSCQFGAGPKTTRPEPAPGTGLPVWPWFKVQNQWYHFGIGAPPILVYFSGDWDVHWGYGVLTHGRVVFGLHNAGLVFDGMVFLSEGGHAVSDSWMLPCRKPVPLLQLDYYFFGGKLGVLGSYKLLGWPDAFFEGTPHS